MNPETLDAAGNASDPTIKKICFPQQNQVAWCEVAQPVCTQTTILLKTRYSGLSNGTERSQMVGGPYGGQWPVAPGYQIVGEVVKCGTAVTTFEEGDLVFHGNFGIGHSDYVLAEEDSLLIGLDPTDDLQTASLWALASVAYRNAQRSQIMKTDRVLVYGGGVIGQAAAQIAQALGAAEVWLVAGDPAKLRAASDRSIKTIDRNATDFQAQLSASGRFSVCIETSGADVLDAIIGTDYGGAVMESAGRVALVAGRFRVDYSSAGAQGKALSISHSTHFLQSHLEDVARLARAGHLDLRPCLRDVVPIGDAEKIYHTLRDDPRSLFGTVFDWS